MRMASTIPTGERFANIEKPRVPRSRFDLSFSHKTTFFDTSLFPVMVEEVLPGDTFDVSVAHVIRMLTPLTPLMDNMFVDFHFFFVPNRLVWENWERFQGAQDNPDDSTDFLIPTLATGTITNITSGSLGDYFGIPVIPGPRDASDVINSLPFRGYRKIWNEWYRDQDLQDSVTVPLDDGPDTISQVLLPRAKSKDYFSSCRPEPQKGPDVLLPLGDTATVYTSASNLVTGAQPGMRIRRTDTGGFPAAAKSLGVATSGETGWNDSAVGANFTTFYPENLYADLEDAIGPSVNAMREAVAIQHLLERDSRGGTRYVEALLNRFGVVSPDFRLQRTEYLGGGRTRVGVQTIAQSSESNTTPQGTLAGMATSTGAGIHVVKSFVEHGYFFCLMSLVTDQTYQQGLRRMWTRQTRYDFYEPGLAHLGEQAVLSKEIYWTGTGTGGLDEGVFGYQERWAEYRYKHSYATSAMSSNSPTPLDSWHLGYDFSARPELNSDFIPADPPIARVVAVDSPEQFVADLYFRFYATRPLPVRSTPGLERF